MALKSNEKKFLGTLVIPLVVVIVASVVVSLLGFQSIAEAISYGGTLTVLLVAVCYIVFFDSKKRWPESSAFERFARLVTFDKT